MKIEMLIEKLQKMAEIMPGAEVKLHGKEGNNALFVVAYKNDNHTVVIEDKEGNDLHSELEAIFEP